MIKTERPFPKRFIITHLVLLKEIAAKRITIYTVNGSHILSSDLIREKRMIPTFSDFAVVHSPPAYIVRLWGP